MLYPSLLKTFILFIYIGLLMPMSVIAQKETDSLTQLISEESNLSKKAELTLQRATTYSRKDSALAFKDIENALAYFNKKKDEKKIIKCLLTKGRIYLKARLYNKSVAYAQQGISLADKSGIKEAGVVGLGELGLAQFLSGDLQAAKKSLLKAIANKDYLKENKVLQLADWYLLLATLEARLGNFVPCFQYFEKATTLAESLQNKKPLIRIYANYANAYDRIDDYDQAMKWHLKAIKTAEIYKDTVWIMREYNNLGIVYKHLNEYDNAIHYYNQSLKIAKKTQNYNSLGNALMNIILVKKAQGKLKGIDSLSKEVIECFKKAHNNRGLANIYHNYGNFLTEAKRYKDAQQALTTALALEKRLGSKAEQAHSMSVMGKLFTDTKQYDSAEIYLNKAQNIYNKIGGSKTYLSDLYFYYKELYLSQHNYKKAYEYQQKEMAIKAKIFDESEKVNALKLKTEYELNKQGAIFQLEKESQHRRQMYFLAIGAALLLILILALIILFQRRKQAKTRFDAELTRLGQENRISLADALKKSEQEERSKIAHKLHDETGALLSIAKLNVSQLHKDVFVAGSDAEQKLNTTKKLLSEVSESVRNISHSLMPIALEKYGLKAALQDLISAINTSGKLIVEDVLQGMEDARNWDKELCLTIYRTVQEVLNNVIRHAQASHVLVQVIELHNSVSIFIEDDGSGLEMKEEKDTGMGLTLLKRNIEYLNGTVEINGQKNKGTVVLAELPIVKVALKNK